MRMILARITNHQSDKMRLAFSNKILDKLKSGEDLYVLTGDVGWNALDKIRELFPKNLINMGVAEQSTLLIAIGMALEGKEVYTYSILPFSTFRIFEQIRLACYNNASIRIVGMGVGYDYDLGGNTHFGLEDIQVMTALPNLTVISPSDGKETAILMDKIKNIKDPVYIRLSKNSDQEIHQKHDLIEIGKALRIREGNDVLIVTTGEITKMAIDAAASLSKDGIECEILDMHTLKPFDGQTIIQSSRDKKAIVVIEENTGGLGKLVSFELAKGAVKIRKFINLKLPDEFVKKVGKRPWMLEQAGLSVDNIYNSIISAIK